MRERVGDRVAISPRGKQRIYQAEFWHDGQHRRKSLKTRNRRVALRRALEIEASLASGEFSPKPPAIKIADAINGYLSHLKAEGRARKTLVRYGGELEALRQFLEQRRVMMLAGITLTLFDAFRAERSRDHEPGTMYHEGVVAKQFLKWCVSRGLLQSDPLTGYKLTRSPRIPKPAPTLDEVNRILAKCSGAARPPLVVLAFTGARVGELQALQKSDVGMESGFIEVRRQLSGPTKTGRARRIPIHGRILPIIRKQYATGSHQLLFTAQPSRTYPQGGRAIDPKRLNERFKAAVARAGLSGFTLHSLRRFFTTHCINNSVPERVVRAWLGHKDQSVTGLYYHLTDDESARFMNGVPFDDHDSTSSAAESATQERRN